MSTLPEPDADPRTIAMAHITTIPRRRGWPGYSGRHYALVGGGGTIRTNLCGGALTDRDLRPRDARFLLRHDHPWITNICSRCLDLFRAAEVAGRG